MAEYVTPQGLQIPTVESLIADVTQQVRSEIDPNLDTGPDDPMAEVIAIVMSHIREAYEVIQVAYNGFNPDAAEDFLLDVVAAITGTKREPATTSKFRGIRRLTVNLDAGTTLLVGRIVRVAGNPNVRFLTTERIGPVPSTGNYLVAAECEVEGPVPCNAGTLTVIVTAVVGWNSVTNAYDAELGKVLEKNPQLRERREREIRASGSGTVDSLRADLLAYEDDSGENTILEATVFQNETDVFDVNGLPPHSLECLVYDGVSAAVPNDAIAQVIWDGKPGGIPMVGTTSGTATDSLGTSRVTRFSRPALREVIAQADLTLDDATEVPADYLPQVQAAIEAEFLRRVRSGKVIRYNHYEAVVVQIPGIDDATVRLGFQATGLEAANTNLTLGIRDMGYIQSSGITVV